MVGFLALAMVLASPRSQADHAGAKHFYSQAISTVAGKVALLVLHDINILDIICMWISSLLIGSLDSTVQSAFPPLSQLAPANTLHASQAL